MPEPIVIGDQPDPQHVAAVTAVAAHLIRGVKATNLPHAVQMDGLVSAYASLVVQHPYCWTPAAVGLREFADLLDQMHMAQAAAAEQQASEAIATAARKPA